jgi:hypothetical protein
MLRLDGRTPEQSAELIHWAQHDEFWMANVLSMDTLRDKFDQLSMKAELKTRAKDKSARFRNQNQPTSVGNNSPCESHPESGLTNWGTCWQCYSERCG